MARTIRIGSRKMSAREIDLLAKQANDRYGTMTRANRRQWIRRFRLLTHVANDALREVDIPKAIRVLREMISPEQAESLIRGDAVGIKGIYPLNRISDCVRAMRTFDMVLASGDKPTSMIEEAFFSFIKRCDVLAMGQATLSEFVWSHAFRFLGPIDMSLVDVGNPVQTEGIALDPSWGASAESQSSWSIALDFRRIVERLHVHIACRANVERSRISPPTQSETMRQIGERVRENFEQVRERVLARANTTPPAVRDVPAVRWDTRQEPIRTNHLSIGEIIDPLCVVSPPVILTPERCAAIEREFDAQLVRAAMPADGLRVSDLEFLTPAEQRQEFARAQLAMAEADAIALRTGALGVGDLQLDELGDLTNSDTWTTPASIIAAAATHLQTQRGEWAMDPGLGDPVYVNPPYEQRHDWLNRTQTQIVPIVPVEFDQLPPQETPIEMRFDYGAARIMSPPRVVVDPDGVVRTLPVANAATLAQEHTSKTEVVALDYYLDADGNPIEED